MQKFVFVSFFAILLLTASVAATPNGRTVGVNVGDWFKYEEIDVTWSSNDPNASKAWYGMDLEMYNQTEWVRVEVTEVSGTNVTIQTVSHFKNDTEEIGSGWIDVDTGDGVNATSTFISANLNEGDAIYTAGNYSNWFINETITREYPDSTRETNHINITIGPYNYTMPPDTEIYYLYSMNFYWDRTTGVMVEDRFEVVNQTGQYLTTWSMSFKITEANTWVVPEFPSFLILPLFMLATLLVTIIHRKKQPSQSPSLFV